MFFPTIPFVYFQNSGVNFDESVNRHKAILRVGDISVILYLEV